MATKSLFKNRNLPEQPKVENKFNHDQTDLYITKEEGIPFFSHEKEMHPKFITELSKKDAKDQRKNPNNNDKMDLNNREIYSKKTSKHSK